MIGKLKVRSIDGAVVAELPLRELSVNSDGTYDAQALVGAREIQDTLMDISLRAGRNYMGTSFAATTVEDKWDKYTTNEPVPTVTGYASGGFVAMDSNGITFGNYAANSSKENKMNIRLQQIKDQKNKVRELQAALANEEFRLRNLIAAAQEEAVLDDARQSQDRVTLEALSEDVDG